MSFGKGSSTTTNTSAPNPAAASAYYNLLNQASSVAATPYQGYGGEYTAPVNQQQQTGIGGINANAGFANPFVLQGAGDITSGASAVTGADIQAHQDPYTQQVIDATQAQFETDNARQQSQVTGNAAAQGALGGNRVGVAQALTAEGQQRAQAPVIAGLQSAGFQNAQTAAQADKNRSITGGSTLAGVGIAGQGAALSGAGAQVGAGTLEQQTQQQQDAALLNAYYQQQAYPFQTTQWLAGIDTGVGSNLGGTSTSTPPPPNPWNTALGLGVAGLGAFANRGGRIAGFASGGAPGPDYSGSPWGQASGWVPTIGITKGSGAPAAPSASKPQAGLTSDQMKGAANLFGKAKNYLSTPGAPIDLSPSAAGVGVDLSSPNTFVGPTQPFEGGLGSLYAAGGSVGPDDFRRGFATDGFVDPDAFVGPVQAGFGTGSVIPTWRDRFADALAVPDMNEKRTREFRNKLVDAGATSTEYDSPVRQGVAAGPLPDPVEVKTAGVAEPVTASPRGNGPKADDFETQTLAYSPDAKAGFGEPMAPEQPEGKKSGLFGGLNLSPEAKQGLIAAGFGIMASRSPFLGEAIGEGGLRGVGAYAGAKEATLSAEKTKADIQHGRDQLAQQAENARNAVKEHSENLAQRKLEHETLTPYQQAQVDQQKLREAIQLRTPVKAYETRSGMTVNALPKINPNTNEIDLHLIHPDGSVDPNPWKPGATPQILGPAKAPADNAPLAPEQNGESATPSGRNEKFLTDLGDKQYADMIKSIADYKTNPAAIYSLRGNRRERAMADVMQYDPSYDGTTFGARNKAVSSFAAGPMANTVRSFDVAISHLDTLDKLGKALANGDTRVVNTIKNGFKSQFGYEAPTNFEAAKEIVGDEIVKAIVGSGSGALGDRDSIKATINKQNSPEQLAGAIRTYTDLMAGQVKGIKHQYETTTMLKNFDDRLSPETRQKLLAHEDKPKAGDEKQFKQGIGVWDGTKWVPKAQ